MSDTPTVLIAGYFGFGNLGDEALLAVATDSLRDSINGIRIIVISGNPDETARTHRVEAISTRSSVVLATLRECNAVILGPGGIFHDVRLPGRPRRQAGLSFFYALALATRDARIPLGVFNVGLGPLDSPAAVHYTARIFAISAFANVRDESSALWLTDRGIVGFSVSTDVAWLYRNSRQSAADSALHPYLAVSIREWYDSATGDHLRQELARALRFLLDEQPQLSVVVVPMQHCGPQSDTRASHLLAGAVDSKRISVVDVTTPRAATRIFAGADVAIAMRLHAAVFAIGAGVPTVGLAYAQKVTDLFSSIGYPGLALPLDISAASIHRAVLDAQEWDRNRVESVVVGNARSALSTTENLVSFVSQIPSRSAADSTHAASWWIRRQTARMTIISGIPAGPPGA